MEKERVSLPGGDKAMSVLGSSSDRGTISDAVYKNAPLIVKKAPHSSSSKDAKDDKDAKDSEHAKDVDIGTRAYRSPSRKAAVATGRGVIVTEGHGGREQRKRC